MAAIRGGFMVWGPFTAGHTLQALCLELSLLELIQRTSVIGYMYRMNWCRGSSRRSTGGTWICMSATRGIRSNEHSRCNQWSRGWWPCTTTSSKCRVAFHHPVHSLHHLRLHSTTSSFSTPLHIRRRWQHFVY